MNTDKVISSVKKLLGNTSNENLNEIEPIAKSQYNEKTINGENHKDSLILVTNINGEIIFINEACSASLGYKPHELIGKHTRIFKTDIHPMSFYRNLWTTILDGKTWSGEISCESKNGEVVWFFMVITPLLGDNNQPYQFSTTRFNITEQKKNRNVKPIKEKPFRYLTSSQTEVAICREDHRTIDPLTKLPDKECFYEDLEREIERAGNRNMIVAIAKLGIDDFKYINSVLGFDIGDHLLKELATRIHSWLPDHISFYHKYGDKFYFLIKENFDVDKLNDWLSELITIINQDPFNIEGNNLFITGSIGASIYPYSGRTKDELLKNAEIAMFRAKGQGKNQYQIFAPTMSIHSYKQFTLRNDSKQALIKDEFHVYYQPRVNPYTDEIISAEALIRWNHQKWGVVLPEEFITMAEESGLIVPIGEWLLKRVCDDIKSWSKRKLTFRKVSINISPLQLKQPNFVDRVSTILRENRVNPKWLEFEISEKIIIEKEESLLNKIIQLNNLGISFALDDFGTGYSSLHFLKKFPCGVVKIDKSLVKEIHKEKENLVILGSVVSLCHKLNKKVVAEGVETKNQLAILKKLNCDEIQGYLYSKAVDKTDFEKLLHDGIKIDEEMAKVYSYSERRRYARIPFEVPLAADMTIAEIEGVKLNIGSSEVMLKNISPGGLSFSSPLLLPVSREIVLQFNTTLLFEDCYLKGTIAWFKETDQAHYQYGVQFNLINDEKDRLIRILNNLQIKLEYKSILPGCRYYKRLG